jgi:hypothetical protein
LAVTGSAYYLFVLDLAGMNGNCGAGQGTEDNDIGEWIALLHNVRGQPKCRLLRRAQISPRSAGWGKYRLHVRK